MWNPDDAGIYLTAQDQGSQNLYGLPMAGDRTDVVQPLTNGTYMLTTSSVVKGKAVGILTSPNAPAEHRFVRRRHSRRSTRTNVNEDILAGKKLGDVKEMWYTSSNGMRSRAGTSRRPASMPPTAT